MITLYLDIQTLINMKQQKEIIVSFRRQLLPLFGAAYHQDQVCNLEEEPCSPLQPSHKFHYKMQKEASK